jgi:hypothetical protein
VNYIVIEGVRPYDGRYEFDLVGSEFTTREWGWIKRLSGYLPLTLAEGFDGADPELFAVWATIALRRAGRIEAAEVPTVFERIADAPFGTTIRLEADPEDEPAADDAGPPPSNSNGNEPISGPASPTNSGESESPTLLDIGTPDSDSSASDRATLEN